MFISVLLLLAGCDGGSPHTSESTFCSDLAVQDNACMNDDNLLECEQAVAECGEEKVLVLESCPLQFSCDD